MYRVWFSTNSLADFIINNTKLRIEDQNSNIIRNKLYESDAGNSSNFHRMPTHIKNILYLDCPDIIVEIDSKPLFSLEITSEAGTGHNAFQRFARIAASIENNVPSFYIYPEAKYVRRLNDERWDEINPLIFKTLEQAMRIYSIPALLYYFPSEFRHNPNPTNNGLLFSNNYAGCPEENSQEMQNLFKCIDELIDFHKTNNSTTGFLNTKTINDRRDFMLQEYSKKDGAAKEWSPITATEKIQTDLLIDYLRKFSGQSYVFSDFLLNRNISLVYKVNAKFRGDPYPGAIAAVDYNECRIGKSYEDRSMNLVMVWGDFSISNNKIQIIGGTQKSIKNFVDPIRKTYKDSNRILLTKSYSQLKGNQIPRYFMQVRFGGTFSKVKHIRVYSYFCDAILFSDGVLWREG